MTEWKQGADRSMTMWNTLPGDPIRCSLPLLFKTVIPDVGTHIRLGYYDGERDAFIESGTRPDQIYRERVECWYQFPMPPIKEIEAQQPPPPPSAVTDRKG
jgi:hypothetical protein